MANKLHKMLFSGATRGAVSKHNYVWKAGQEVDAPEGEFKHLGPNAFKIVKGPGPETATAPSAPENAAMPKAEKR